jgi:hypothetical protein
MTENYDALTETRVSKPPHDLQVKVIELLDRGDNRLNQTDVKGCLWEEPIPNKFQTIPLGEISSIFSEVYNPEGGPNHLSINDVINLFQQGKFDWDTSNYRSPILAYQLPDGTYYVQSGRHRTIGAFLAEQTHIQASVYRLKRQSE